MNKSYELNENHLELSAHKGLSAIWLEKNKKNLGILFMAERFVWFKLQLMVIKSESLQNDLTSGKQHLVSELLFAIAKMAEMFPNHKMINTKVFLG